MIRILHCVNNMHRAGLETMLMNYYRNIDRTKIQFDFLTHRPERSDYDDEIESLGGKVYYAPRLYPHNYIAYFKWTRQFYKEHPEYKIVHSHIDAMSYLPLLAAKKAGVPIRIAHSHNTSIDRDFKYLLKKYFKSRILSVANVLCSCGEEAGKFLFGDKEFMIVPNAVEAKLFHFNPIVRERKRKELGVENSFIIGHIGRICHQKNHKYLIDIFKEIYKIDKTAILLIIGVGDQEKQIRQYVTEQNMNQCVRFLGNRQDVSELYQAMDVFVLPSLFEGVPLVGIEAQFADLPCFFSDTVPREVAFGEKVQFVSLDSNAEIWAEEIRNCKKLDRLSDRKKILSSCYDIKVAHRLLEDYYITLSKSCEMTEVVGYEIQT